MKHYTTVLKKIFKEGKEIAFILQLFKPLVNTAKKDSESISFLIDSE